MVTYLKYLCRSTNEHGVHSPFVYDLVTKALRKKTAKPLHPTTEDLPFYPGLPNKYRGVVNRALHHLFGDTAPRMASAMASDSEIKKADLVYLDLQQEAPRPELLTLVKTLQNDTPLLVVHSRDRDTWTSLIHHENIHLTVDCHKVGFAWKRAQQAKENFTIRL